MTTIPRPTTSPSVTTQLLQQNISKEEITSTPLKQRVDVEYRGDRGFINFECDQCVTICVREFPEHPARNVNVVVYHYDFDKIIYLDSK